LRSSFHAPPPYYGFIGFCDNPFWRSPFFVQMECLTRFPALHSYVVTQVFLFLHLPGRFQSFRVLDGGTFSVPSLRAPLTERFPCLRFCPFAQKMPPLNRMRTATGFLHSFTQNRRCITYRPSHIFSLGLCDFPVLVVIPLLEISPPMPHLYFPQKGILPRFDSFSLSLVIPCDSMVFSSSSAVRSCLSPRRTSSGPTHACPRASPAICVPLFFFQCPSKRFPFHAFISPTLADTFTTLNRLAFFFFFLFILPLKRVHQRSPLASPHLPWVHASLLSSLLFSPFTGSKYGWGRARPFPSLLLFLCPLVTRLCCASASFQPVQVLKWRRPVLLHVFGALPVRCFFPLS